MSEKIRALNDALRTSLDQRHGRIMMTDGVDALPTAEKAAVLEKVRTFTAFSKDNDPHSEHDFINVEHNGVKYFAKIDYYDRRMEYGSEDPADPEKTTRVLTVMRADEY